ncbi:MULTISPECIES: hypothetical protein [Rhizobium/Agrobacterium group]|uniref:hypothetical protein n=1 Tax=Rhizobium/Agrobacterium group TaxID=227290 RepID=UPI0002FCBFF8|nr:MULTISPECIES: hypothetical protein [Rhizobium/Agrobacterium group]MUO30803.1 hypothetical protein [Agrobacterium vitis]
MTLAEHVVAKSIHRHCRETNLAAHKPVRVSHESQCKRCGAVLTMAEIIERHCIACQGVQRG